MPICLLETEPERDKVTPLASLPVTRKTWIHSQFTATPDRSSREYNYLPGINQAEGELQGLGRSDSALLDINKLSSVKCWRSLDERRW